MGFTDGFRKEAISHETAKSALRKAWDRLSAVCKEAPALTDKYLKQYARFHQRVHKGARHAARRSVDGGAK